MQIISPGGNIATRPLHFIWILDTSGSMSIDGKIQSLNQAIEIALPEMRAVADENANARVLIRVITFSSGARWLTSQPTALADFRWNTIPADNGVTDLGAALKLVAEQLKMPPMEERALPPVLVLVTDGQPTDNYMQGVQALLSEPWGQRAVRIAIAIGGDADLEVLQKFIAHPEMKPLLASNPDALVSQIKWASTAVVKSASAPASQGGSQVFSGNVPVPHPAPVSTTVADVW